MAIIDILICFISVFLSIFGLGHILIFGLFVFFDKSIHNDDPLSYKYGVIIIGMLFGILYIIGSLILSSYIITIPIVILCIGILICLSSITEFLCMVGILMSIVPNCDNGLDNLSSILQLTSLIIFSASFISGGFIILQSAIIMIP